MDLLEGAVIGVLSGSLVTFLMALILAVSFISLFVGWEGAWPTFRNLIVLMPIIIGVWVVPVSMVLGMVYADKRRVGRIEREVAGVADNK